MARDVKITISFNKPAGSVGLGCPLILEENATTEVAYTEVANIGAVVAAGFTKDSDVYKAAQLMFMQKHAPAKIAVCAITEAAETWLAKEENVRKDWRQLVVISGSDEATDVAAVMTVIEAQTTYPKMYYANLNQDDTTKLTVSGVERTVLLYYTPSVDVPSPVAALVGEIGGLEVGSYTLNNMVVKGVEGLDLSAEEIEALHTKGVITFVLSAGDVVASEGKARAAFM